MNGTLSWDWGNKVNLGSLGVSSSGVWVIGLDPAGSIDTFGFLGLVGSEPPGRPPSPPGVPKLMEPVFNRELDKLDDDEEIAFVTFVGIMSFWQGIKW